MKKLLALLMTLILCVGCLSACGGQKTNAGAKLNADADDVTIEVWTNEAGAQAHWEKLVGEWNATTGDEKNIFIKWTTTTDNTVYDAAEQNGTLPHIMKPTDVQLKKMILNNSAMPIDELPGGAEYVKEYNLAGIDGLNIKDGKTYNLRTTINTAGLIINEDLFVKAGIVDENGKAKAPETMSELREAAKKITDPKTQVYGYAFPGKFALAYTVTPQVSHSFGKEGTKEAMSYVDLDKQEVVYDGYKDAHQWLFDLKNDGSLFPGAETLDNDTARAYFSQGMVGMFPAISWDVEVFNNQFPANFNWKVVKFPVLDSHEDTGNYYNALSGGMSIGRNAAEKNPEETMEVYKFITSVETRAARFEEGISLSAKNDVMEVIDKEKVDPNFFEFSKFVDGTRPYAQSESYVNEGETWANLFMKAWIGDITLDEAIEIYEKDSTASLRKAIKEGKYDVERQKRVYKYLQGDKSQDVTSKNW